MVGHRKVHFIDAPQYQNHFGILKIQFQHSYFEMIQRQTEKIYVQSIRGINCLDRTRKAETINLSLNDILKQYGRILCFEKQATRHTWLSAFSNWLISGADFNHLVVMSVVAFMLYSTRIFILPLWTAVFIPVISPLYMQPMHWASSPNRLFAILCHVCCGITAVGAGLVQLNARIRKQNRSLHRWMGRVYFLSGLLCVHSLWVLQPIVGKGPSVYPNRPLQLFNVVGIVSWTLCTVLALFYISFRGDVSCHKRWMVRSFCILLTPMFQRGWNIVFIFAQLMVVLAYCCMVSLLACTGALDGLAAHWPTVGWSAPLGLKFSNFSSSITEPRSGGWELLPACARSIDVRVRWPHGEALLSMEGIGVLEHLGFAASAWLGLFLAVVTSEVGLFCLSRYQQQQQQQQQQCLWDKWGDGEGEGSRQIVELSGGAKPVNAHATVDIAARTHAEADDDTETIMLLSDT